MNRTLYTLLALPLALAGAPALAQTGSALHPGHAVPGKAGEPVERYRTANGTERAGGSVLFYEDFGNGLAGNNPFGAWTVGGANAALWEHDFDGSQGQYSQGADTLLSASSANGWMMFDGDASNPGLPSTFTNREGYLISPVIDLTGTPNVHLEFDHRFRFCCSFEFKLRVSVTTDGFATSTDFVVSDPYLRNENVPNPVDQRLSISSALVGGNLSTVQFRFEWEGLQVDANGQGTSHYFWMIDDVTLMESPTDDIVMTKADHADFVVTGELPYSVYAYSQLRPITFKGYVLNDGVNGQTNVVMNVDAVGAQSSFTTASNGISVSSLDTDSLLGGNTFTPTAAADTFAITYSLTQDQADVNPWNNDTIGSFAVSEHILARDLGAVEGTFNNGALDEMFELCVAYDITSDVTLYSIDVVVTPTSDIGAVMDGTVYDINQDLVDETYATHEVVAADTTGGGEEAMFIRLFFAAPMALTAGETYFACVRSVGGDTLGVAFSGRSNNGTCLVNYNATWYNNQNIPMVRMNFNPAGVGIAEQAAGNLSAASARPNPLTDQTTLSFTLADRERITLEMTDAAGRQVRNQPLGLLRAGTHQVDVNAGDLDAGVYLYTLRGQTGQLTGRLVVRR